MFILGKGFPTENATSGEVVSKNKLFAVPNDLVNL